MAGMMKKMKTAGGKGVLSRLFGETSDGELASTFGAGNTGMTSLPQPIMPDMMRGGGTQLPPDILRALSHKGKKGR